MKLKSKFVMSMRATNDKMKNSQYDVIVPRRRQRKEKNCPTETSWPNHGKNEQHIGSKRTKAPQKLDSLNTMMQRSTSKNVAGFFLPV